MLRNIVRLHTGVLVVAALVLLTAPARVLSALGIADASFPVLALTRVIVGLVVVVAAGVYPLPELPAPARGNAVRIIAITYAFLTLLTVIQQVAIWSNTAGMLLSVGCLLFTGAFAWMAASERRVALAGA